MATSGRPLSARLNVSNGVREGRRATPDKVALIDGDRRWTYAALDERSSRLAGALLEDGLRPGDCVGVLMGNRAEILETVVALGKAGMVFVPLNPRLSEPELRHVVDHAGVAGLVADAAHADHYAEWAPRLRTTLVVGDPKAAAEIEGRSYEGRLEAARPVDPRIDAGDRDPFSIVYTSGTTGRPKGVVVSHSARVLGMFAAGVEWGLGPASTSVAVSPIVLGAGFTFGYTSIFLGGTTTVLGRWDPEEFLSLARRDRATAAFLVPTHAQTMRAAEVSGQAPMDAPTLRTLYFNAASLPVPLKSWVIDRFPDVGVHELYGSTEGGVVTNLRPDHARSKAGSVGKPWFMTEVRLLDADGREVAPGKPGELFSRSPLMMNGYHADEVATSACMTDDGFLTVGDLATVDDEGFISIVGRTKDMIISGGVNIYPREIEDLLVAHEAVAEAAVVGMPDDKWGERVTAFVVGHPGRDVPVDELNGYLSTRLADYKRPRHYEVVSGLPRNSNGKVVKRQLVAPPDAAE